MHSQALLGVGFIIFILLMQLGSVTWVLYLFLLIGLNWCLQLGHLFLVLPEACFPRAPVRSWWGRKLGCHAAIPGCHLLRVVILKSLYLVKAIFYGKVHYQLCVTAMACT